MAQTRNPNPAEISDDLWWFWGEFDDLEKTVIFGGALARKPGYHNKRVALPRSDYSAGGQVAADAQGPGDKCSAIDLTMSDAAMRLYTTRLDKAARARDERLFIGGEPILREFIGTKDNRTVYCYVLKGGRPLGVGADAGPDPGRDRTHLWHLHLSIVRRFLATRAAFERLLSVLRGESLAAWRARTKTTPAVSGGNSKGDDMPTGAELMTSDVVANRPWRWDHPDNAAANKQNPNTHVTWGFAIADTWDWAHRAAVAAEASVKQQAVQAAKVDALLKATEGGAATVEEIQAQFEAFRAQLTDAVIGNMLTAVMPPLVAALAEKFGDAADEELAGMVAAAVESAHRKIAAEIAGGGGMPPAIEASPAS